MQCLWTRRQVLAGLCVCVHVFVGILHPHVRLRSVKKSHTGVHALHAPLALKLNLLLRCVKETPVTRRSVSSFSTWEEAARRSDMMRVFLCLKRFGLHARRRLQRVGPGQGLRNLCCAHAPIPLPSQSSASQALRGKLCTLQSRQPANKTDECHSSAAARLLEAAAESHGP